MFLFTYKCTKMRWPPSSHPLAGYMDAEGMVYGPKEVEREGNEEMGQV